MQSFNWLYRCSPNLLNKPLHHQVARFDLDRLESRLLYSSSVEPIDGVGNNVANPAWGSAGTDLIRLAAAAYADRKDSPNLSGDLSARAISNILNNQADPSNSKLDIATVDQNSLSDYGYAFGQFMDHDLDHTPDGGASFPIAVATDDLIGPAALPFTRSIIDPATGTSTSNPAQQITTVTSYFDLSQVYGSSQDVAASLRTFSGGLMKTSPGNMLPYDNTTYFTPAQIKALGMVNDAGAVPQEQLFATGDVRGNENVELTAIQTLFVRNHNRIAGQLQKAHPGWSDEKLYQEARKLNIAEYQSIIYNEWIPAVLGVNAMPRYTGYRANVDATISNEFSTVAFRFGHSLLSAQIERLDNQGNGIPDGTQSDSSLSLAEDFFDPNILNPAGVVDPLTGHVSSDIGPILKGLSSGVSQASDILAVGDVRNLLFGNGGLGGEDLIARDTQRDRDNGIPDYNTLHAKLGLRPITSFSQITSNVTVQKELAAAYPGGINTIDAFEGGMAEDHVRGSDVGPLFQAIMVNQFVRLRDGDRFFYLNENLSSEEWRIIGGSNTLSQVIENNSSVRNLQSDVFLFKASISGNVSSSTSGGRFGGFSGRNSIAGVTVELENDEGDVVATTRTDFQGNYTFNQLSGSAANPGNASGVSATGTYQIVLSLHNGMRLASAAPAPMTISTGDVNVTGVNFLLNLVSGRGERLGTLSS